MIESSKKLLTKTYFIIILIFLQHFAVFNSSYFMNTKKRKGWLLCVSIEFITEKRQSVAIERNEEGKRNWLSKKEKKKVKKVSLWKITKESFDLNALCEFPNLEVIEIAGFDEFKPLELKHIEVLYQFRRLKCLRLSSCLIPEPFEKGKWKHLRTLEID